MAMRALLSAAAAAVACAQSATLVWQQSESYAVYTSASLTRIGSDGSYRGGVADWLNPPIQVSVFNVSATGEAIWNFQAGNDQTTFQVDMARHMYAAGKGAVDTVVAQAQFTLPSSCAVFGFSSTAPTGTPVWNYTIPQCDVGLLYDVDLMVDLSDDGSVAAFATYANNSDGVTTARCYAFNAQSGALLFTHDLGAGVQPAGGGVSVTTGGEWIAYTNGEFIYILDGANGTLRDTISQPYGLEAVISGDGNTILSATEDTGLVYQWSSSAGHYQLAHSLTPPSSESWYPYDVAIGSDATSTYGTFAWIDGEALQARITVFNLASGTLLSDILTPQNAKLQTTPTVRADANFVGICVWGDSDDVWTVGLLRAGDSSLSFNATTPGSMFGVDVVVDSVTATNTVVYLAAAGKHVPANMFGNGGDAYSWRVVVPNA